jgi:hypothetical protein
VRLVNDAVMQALGAYHGGRMRSGARNGARLRPRQRARRRPPPTGRAALARGQLGRYRGRAGLERLGHPRWYDAVAEVVPALRRAVVAHYVGLGGGNAAKSIRRRMVRSAATTRMRWKAGIACGATPSSPSTRPTRPSGRSFVEAGAIMAFHVLATDYDARLLTTGWWMTRRWLRSAVPETTAYTSSW